MNRNMMILWMATLLVIVGCACRSGNTRMQEPSALDQIEKDYQEGRITSEELGRKMIDVGREELERDYREGRTTKTEYRRRTAVLLTEAIYQELAHTTNKDHLIHALEIAKEVDHEIAALLLYRNDGIVSMSIHKNQIGSSISLIDSHVRLDEEGLLATDAISESGKLNAPASDKKKRFGMARPFINQKACYECHGSDKRVLGGLYVMINAEEM